MQDAETPADLPSGGRGSRRARRWGAATLLALAAALLCRANPFPPLAALGARVALPPLVRVALDPSTVARWCLVGDFQGWIAGTHPMQAGAGFDRRAAEMRIWTLEHTFDAPGRHLWKAVPCEAPGVGLPDEAAWVHVASAGQRVRFVLETRAEATPDRPAYRLDAEDGVTTFTAVGDFQGWNEQETLTTLIRVGARRYELLARVNVPGPQRARILAAGSWDGFGAAGRSADPGDLEFITVRRGERVLFRLDTAPGRPSVLYDLPRAPAWLAYEGGAALLAWLLAGLALLTGARALLLHAAGRPAASEHSGCPRCGAEQLQRMRRRRLDRLLDRLGLPARRYYCTRCLWQGLRIPS